MLTTSIPSATASISRSSSCGSPAYTSTKPQVLCRRRRGAHRSQLPHPLDDALAALGQVTLLAQLDPQHDAALGERPIPIMRTRIERYAGRIGAAPVQGVEHGEHNPAYRRCRVGLIKKTDDTAHGRCLPCPAR